jgi:Lrp/AsnC family transcriptional regulator
LIHPGENSQNDPEWVAILVKIFMESSAALDGFDLAILASLQDNAAQPVAQIAERVHLSQNACWRRIKRLEDDGFIKKRVALLAAEKLKAGVTVFVTVRVAEHSEAWLEAFAKAVIALPEVVEFYRMSGEVDYLIKLQVEDIGAYDRVYKRLIRTVRLSDVTSTFAMEELKHTTAVPLPDIARS